MLELYTFSVSHFSEKSRWMLDACGAPYRETRWTPFFHVWPALRLGGRGTTVPILRHEHGAVQDSTRILHWLDAHQPGFDLLPRAPDLRAEVLALEERFDRVGHPVMRFGYAEALKDPAAVSALWTPDARPWQRRVIERSYPLLRTVFQHKAGIDLNGTLSRYR